MRYRLLTLTAATLLAAGCSGGSDEEAGTTTTRTDTAAAVPAGSPGAGAGDAELVPSIVEQVQPSVVAVVTDQGEGSGVIFDSDDGFVITNHHVAGGAQELEIHLASGEVVPAELRASSERFDIAVLEVERDDLPAARFSVELPRVGALAIAMGNPQGFENSVTAGIVSGLNRDLPAGGSTPALVDLIQTDAAISPGNSGGALVDRAGQVIGINVAYLPPQAGAVSLGFAIAAPVATDVARQLIETGEVSYPYLGIQPAQVTPELEEAFELGTDSGVLVDEVVDGSPADEAGLERGDVIVRLDGSPIEFVEDIFSELREHEPGDEVTLTVLRDGERRQVEVTLGEAPAG